MVKILTISDEIDPKIYHQSLTARHSEIDLVISCGDLSYQYLDYILTKLNKPLYFVHGNHDRVEMLSRGETRKSPLGADNLHRRMIRKNGLLIAGVEGSIKYNRKTPYQYGQGGMWAHVFSLIPGMIFNKLVFGRYLDIFVSHAPPRGTHEGKDFAHQGIDAFRWLITTFHPRYHLHGHIHHYHPDSQTETRVGRTIVINCYRSKQIDLE